MILCLFDQVWLTTLVTKQESSALGSDAELLWYLDASRRIQTFLLITGEFLIFQSLLKRSFSSLKPAATNRFQFDTLTLLFSTSTATDLNGFENSKRYEILFAPERNAHRCYLGCSSPIAQTKWVVQTPGMFLNSISDILFSFCVPELISCWFIQIVSTATGEREC